MSKAKTEMTETTSQVHLCILMAVYNGARWLPEQLESFAAQDHQNWQLLASDDRSVDRSCELIAAFAAGQPQAVTCLAGPGQGGAQNFLSLLRAVPDYLPQDGWLAFSDQDDIWCADRLSRGIARLQRCDPDRPALYCSATTVVDQDGQKARPSRRHQRAPSFRNALTQNIAAGNTILLNAAATRLLCAAAQEIDDFVVHDWWAYQMITGVGGEVIYDPQPTLQYRQHTGNEIGANQGLKAAWRRGAFLLKGGVRGWTSQNLQTLAASEHRFGAGERRSLAQLAQVHRAGVLGRLWGLVQLRPYRQTRLGTVFLYLAVLLKRL